jgi:hypothetical protein
VTARPSPAPAAAHYSVALVGCGKSKAATPCWARQLYTSTLFRRSLAFAEHRAERVLIVSALFGLVLPDAPMEPYDARLEDLDAQEQRAWAASIARDLGPGDGRQLLLLAGGPYAQLLAPALEAIGWAVDQPLRGKMVGQRQGWLKAWLEGVV